MRDMYFKYIGVIMLSSVYKVLKSDSEFLTAVLKQSQVDIFERRGDLLVV
jgi:hypothetical protein